MLVRIHVLLAENWGSLCRTRNMHYTFAFHIVWTLASMWLLFIVIFFGVLSTDVYIWTVDNTKCYFSRKYADKATRLTFNPQVNVV